MMEAIEQFVVDNFVLVIVGAIVFVIVVDEVLGLTRAVFGDDDDAPGAPGAPGERPDPRVDSAADGPRDAAEDAADDGTPTVDDLLDPPSRD